MYIYICISIYIYVSLYIYVLFRNHSCLENNTMSLFVDCRSSKKTVNAITKLALYSPKHHILQSRARNTSFNPIEIIIQITGVSGQKAVLFSRLRPLIIQSGAPVYDS